MRIKIIALSVVSGVMAGIAATVFLYLLNYVTDMRESHTALIWYLPVAGFILGWVYHHYGQDISRGNNLIFEEVHEPKNVLPAKMAPFILLSTLWTHLFGGSAGREGTAVQMSASLTDQLSRAFHLSKAERKNLLIAGTGAGFGAAIGAPIAGIIFGMEVVYAGKIKWVTWIESITASYIAYFTTQLLRAPHSIFPKIPAFNFTAPDLLWILLAGLTFGLAAKLFVLAVHALEKFENQKIIYSPLKPFFAGIALVVLYKILNTDLYAGLGISTIQSALAGNAPLAAPFWKFIATVLTVASGFKGGEFVPLVFVGSTLGASLSTILPLSAPILASLGFAAVFAGAAQAPLACAVMAGELFGWAVLPYALITCYISYLLCRRTGLYHRN